MNDHDMNTIKALRQLTARYIPDRNLSDQKGTTSMTNQWRVHPGGLIDFANAGLYAEARHRVLHSRRLREYLDIIMGDGYAGDADHLKWVSTAKVADIESWAGQIRND